MLSPVRHLLSLKHFKAEFGFLLNLLAFGRALP